MRQGLFAIAAAFLAPLLCSGQDTAELLNRMKAMEDKIKSLESEVQELKGQQAALTAAVTASAPATPAPSERPWAMADRT